MRKSEYNQHILAVRKQNFNLIFFKKYPEYLLLLLFALIGIFTVNSYGYAWDERDQREIGVTCFNYVFNGDLSYRTLQARDHGAIFELFLAIIEKILGLEKEGEIIVMRHLVSHIIFLISALFFYRLILLIYNNKKLAILGFLMLVIQPTIYGHSFFNSKDVPFLAILIICFYQFAIAFKNKKYYQFILLALFSCILINIRIMGILFVAFVIFFLIFDLITFYKEKGSTLKHLILLILFTSATVLFTIAAWPLLWEKPLENFIYAIQNLSKYPFPGNVLFNGELISAQKLSWNYIPTWFSISNPIVYLFLGFSGLLLFVFYLLKDIIRFNLKGIDKNNLLYVFSFLIPVFVVIYLKSVLYDSWRHLFYIYPAFILLAIYFINYCYKTKFKSVTFIFTYISIVASGLFMIIYFPFHHVYFNAFVSLHQEEYLRKNYDLDYWGVSYNKSLEYILKIDKRDTIYICAPNPPCEVNIMMLPEKDQKRFVFRDFFSKPDYYITNYRDHPEDYNPEEFEEIKSFYVLNSKINSIFKFKK